MVRTTNWHERDSFSAVRPFSDKIASWFDWTTPNLVTLAGLLLALPMIACFAFGATAAGAILFALSAMTDFVDGALARYQDDRMKARARECVARHDKHYPNEPLDVRVQKAYEALLDAERRHNWLLRRGKTEEGRILTGTSFDPFVDKVRYLGVLLPLGWSVLFQPFIMASAAFALCLTIGRPIFAVKDKNRGKANRWGKFKAHAEILLVTALVLLPRHGSWLAPAHVLFAAATALGAMSLGGQVWTLVRNRKAAP